ncbi:helix-turn-helix domain-containing protein [Paenibacillus hexagrammi]|uniref:Helix-turn-helix domain-containing protein n=1 Tax=Paenibacillus hexagrammi TaxID=2908839 RepID=A0ABY3SFC6_9BACL|nr:helix-turn-helix domain-containing protein [Paenibacillus sp. YPD9-1]UJF32128.1 helix-turn-helix domain-containing protein [Paenibacillus sp. YPD9-1]
MAIKGQTFRHYPESIKTEAIRLHEVEGWSYREITEHLGIYDKGRVKKWMSKYRECGEESFKDKRGGPFRAETEQERLIRQLQLEVDVLKKWLQFLSREVHKINTTS